MRSLVLVLLLAASSTASAQEPPVMLWVWHGAQDLRGMPESIGVAYLARTMVVRRDGTVVAMPRHSPLYLDERTTRWGVLRIELERGVTPEAFARAEPELIAGARTVANEPLVRALQIDFDAPRSLRPSYAAFLAHVRAVLAPDQRLSMTALGSWCVSDRWLDAAGVDVVVPMLFGPGHDVELVADVLRRARVLPEPRCRDAVGVLEGSVMSAAPTVFVFPTSRWTLARAAALAR
jgi:hypothetical protein